MKRETIECVSVNPKNTKALGSSSTSAASKRKKEKGASLVEYALLIALIAVICIAAMQFLGKSISGRFSTIGSQITAG